MLPTSKILFGLVHLRWKRFTSGRWVYLHLTFRWKFLLKLYCNLFNGLQLLSDYVLQTCKSSSIHQCWPNIDRWSSYTVTGKGDKSRSSHSMRVVQQQQYSHTEMDSYPTHCEDCSCSHSNFTEKRRFCIINYNPLSCMCCKNSWVICSNVKLDSMAVWSITSSDSHLSHTCSCQNHLKIIVTLPFLWLSLRIRCH